jgi:hypothetical protein
MSAIEDVIEKFSGFITKEQAEYLLKISAASPTGSLIGSSGSEISAKDILNYLSQLKTLRKQDDDNSLNPITVNVKDHVYRIFNPVTFLNKSSAPTTTRKIILGEEGSTIILNLAGKLSDLIDLNAFERGDIITVKNVAIDRVADQLKSTVNTEINRVSQSKIRSIADYSLVVSDMHKIDIFGRVLEITPVKHIVRLGNSGNIAVASCTITDSSKVLDVSFWGSSALMTEKIKTNDFVKLEFCHVKVKEEKISIQVNDDSRVLTSDVLKTYVPKK